MLASLIRYTTCVAIYVVLIIDSPKMIGIPRSPITKRMRHVYVVRAAGYQIKSRSVNDELEKYTGRLNLTPD
jgi:hypothetical protein